jgi:hypothetical protein
VGKSVPPILLPLPCMVLCCESVCTRSSHANISFFFSDTRLPTCVLPSLPRPSPDLPACASNSRETRLGRRASTCTQFTPHPRPRLVHLEPAASSTQGEPIGRATPTTSAHACPLPRMVSALNLRDAAWNLPMKPLGQRSDSRSYFMALLVCEI